MKKPKAKKIVVPGCSIWPQPKKSPRKRYRITYGPRGNRKTVIASTLMDETVELAMKLVKQREGRRLGLVGADEHRYAEQDRRPVLDHLGEWKQAMTDEGLSSKHVSQFYQCARDILVGTPEVDPDAPRNRGRARAVKLLGCGVRHVSEIVPSKVRRQVAAVKDQTSGANANRYLDALCAFLNWGVGDTRWPKNACTHLDRYNKQLDRKRRRRVLSAKEIAQLIEKTEAGPVRSGLSGKERSLVYRTCLAAGLRRREARTLPVHDARLEGDEPGLWISESVGKNKRKRSWIPIPPAIAAELLEQARDKKATEPLLVVPDNAARMLKADLEASGLEYQTADGVFDFHALRHECGALLISAGITPKAVQEHMRHSSIKMTLDTYGHLMADDRTKLRESLRSFDAAERANLAEAAKKSGGLLPEKLPAEADAPATPTPPEKAQRNAQRTRGSKWGSTVRKTTGREPGQERNMSFSSENAGGVEWSHGESNPDLLNAIQPSKRQNHPHHNKLTPTSGKVKAQRAARSGPHPTRHPRRQVRFTQKQLAQVEAARVAGGIESAKEAVLDVLAQVFAKPNP